jgi:hypothetical protein
MDVQRAESQVAGERVAGERVAGERVAGEQAAAGDGGGAVCGRRGLIGRKGLSYVPQVAAGRG